MTPEKAGTIITETIESISGTLEVTMGTVFGFLALLIGFFFILHFLTNYFIKERERWWKNYWDNFPHEGKH